MGLLPSLANGKVPGEVEYFERISSKLKSNLSHLNVEHQLIKTYVKEMKQQASKNSLTVIIEFENQLLKHARMEEAILFPAGILAAEFIKQKYG